MAGFGRAAEMLFARHRHNVFQFGQGHEAVSLVPPQAFR
jgi:hypothetical protein